MKYLPIKRISIILPRNEAQERADKLNKKNPHLHFKPRRIPGSIAEDGCIIVGAKRNATI